MILSNFKHIAYYKDEVESEVIKFKNGDEVSVHHWLNIIKKLSSSTFPKVDYIIRALGSRESSCTTITQPLDLVGELIAEKIGATYITTILSKQKTEQLKFAGGEFKRQAILNNTYSCDLATNNISNESSFLIIDDVSTTGTTFTEIKRAILKASKKRAEVHCFSLVKTPWNRHYNHKTQKLNHDFYEKLISA